MGLALLAPCATVVGAIAGGFSVLTSASAYAQAPAKINIYRYVLDLDVPESPGLIALDATGNHVLRGSSPKPIAASVILQSNGNGAHTKAAAVDIVPYFLVGGGKRSLRSYRAMTVAGRLTRVITKTSLSIAARSDGDTPGLLRLGLALRTTFHDPHDPISTTRLPEAVDSALASHGVVEHDLSVEQLGDRGVELRSLFAAARREVSGHGDVQVTGGWGVATNAGGSVLEADSLRGTRHTFWLTGQHSVGPRLDLLATTMLRATGGDGSRFRFGLGIQRKADAADFRAELYYDRADRRINPGVSAELRTGNGIGLVAAVGNGAEAGPGRSPRLVRASVLLRWYATSERR
jgi:hypothetical protein